MSQPSNMNVVLGTMTIGEEGFTATRISKVEEVNALLDLFHSHGYRDLDTARAYGGGTTEAVLSQTNYKEKGLTMATKVYPTKGTVIGTLVSDQWTHKAEDVRACAMKCLETLGASKIDLFYLHCPDRATPFEETLREINNLYKEGLILKFGISNYFSWEVAKICEVCKANDFVLPSVYQGLYNVFHRVVEPELIPCLRHYGISFYVYNPLAGGFLTGKFSREQGENEEGGRFDKNSWMGKFHRGRYWNDQMFDAMDILKPVLEKHNLTAAECALRWLTHHSALSTKHSDAVIIGVSSAKHLDSNLVDLKKGPLPEDVVEALDAGWGKSQHNSATFATIFTPFNMAWRSNETPMEFEYDNGVGDVDRSETRSPFAKLAGQPKAGTLDRNFGSTFKSPMSSRNQTFEATPAPQTPKVQAHVFREQINTDFSSAAESSPDAGHGADSEDTPDPKRIENVTIFRGSSPHKGKTPPPKRVSWLQQKLGTKQHTQLIKKAHKRKRREVEREDRSSVAIRRGSDDPYGDDDSSRPSSADGSGPFQSRKKTKEVGTIAAILSFIHEHPRLPTILAFYGQCIFSLFMLAMFGWMIWSMYRAVMNQIEVEAERLGEDARRVVEACARSWVDNACDASRVPPALQASCDDWNNCRHQDWRAKGRAMIGAQTFAHILNSFVEPLSYKLILVGLACMALLVASPFALLNPVRRATENQFQQPQQQQHHHESNFFPQTPSRQMQNEWADANGMSSGFFTPQTGRQWSHNDWGSPSKRMEGRSRSPVKQLEFRKFA